MLPEFDADYWVVNLRNPVRFSQAVAKAAETHATFVEISPHPLLTHGIGETLASVSSDDHFSVTAAMKRGDDETLSVHEQLATLGVTGDPDRRASPRGDSRFAVAACQLLDRGEARRPRVTDVHPLLGVHVEMPSGHEHVWQTDIGVATLPWLADQTIGGHAVVTAAGFAEMALAAAAQALGDGVQVSAFAVERPLILDAQTRVTTQLSLSPDVNRVEIQARSAGGNWTRHAVADIDVTPQSAPAGQQAGQGTEITLPDEVAGHPEYRIHPVLLDAALRQLAATVPEQSEDTSYQAVSVETIRVFAPIRSRVRSHAELEKDSHRGHIVLTDDAGAVLAELTGVELKPVDLASVPLSLEQKIFDAAWVPSPATHGGAVADGTWVVLAESDPETTGSRSKGHRQAHLVDPACGQRHAGR